MSHVFIHDGRYFRVDITELVASDKAGKTTYVSWCSEAFKELKDLPKQALSQFISGPPLLTYEEARGHAYDWIKTNCDGQKTIRPKPVPDVVSVIFTVWLFKGEASSGFDFEEFADAKAFAKAAEKGVEITKVEIKNNESPQYLTIWEKGKPK
jgi:hypothetical protein